jgi:hypothetical protein
MERMPLTVGCEAWSDSVGRGAVVPWSASII